MGEDEAGNRGSKAPGLKRRRARKPVR